MGKRADKAKLKELMAKQQKRQDQHVAWHDRERANLIRRYYLGVVDPERYYKYAVAHRMIQMLAQLEDYYLATIEAAAMVQGDEELRGDEIVKIACAKYDEVK